MKKPVHLLLDMYELPQWTLQTVPGFSCLATLATRKAGLRSRRLYGTSSVGVESGKGRKRRSQRTSPTSALFSGELLTPTTAKTFKPMLHQRANIQISVREGIYSGLVLSGETEITKRSQVTKKEFGPFLPDLKPLEKLEMGEVK